MLFIGNDHTIRNFSQCGEPSADRGSPVRRPRHCGDGMQLIIHGAAAEGSTSLGVEEDGPDLRLVWHCRCGFRLDPQPDPRERVWAAAALVETCQWELDHALVQLHGAIRAASDRGMPIELLAESAQLSRHEIQMILRKMPAPSAPAG
jgi:hypothetical protein